MRSYSFLTVLILVFLSGDPLSVKAEESGYVEETFGDYDQAFGKLRKERDKLVREISALKAERDQLDEQLGLRLAEADSRAEKFQSDLDDAHNRMAMLESEKTDLLEKIRDLELKLSRYDDILSSKDSVFMEAKDESETLKKNVTDLETVLQRSSQMIQKLKREKEGLESELEMTKSRLREYYSGQEGELGKIKADREDLLNQLRVITSKLKSAEDQKKEALSESRELRKKMRAEEEKALERESVMKKEKTRLTEDNERLADDNKKLRDDQAKKARTDRLKIEDLESKNRALERLATLANEKLQYYEGIIAGYKEQKLKVSEDGQEVAKLRNESAAKDRILDRLKAELQNLKRQYLDLLGKAGRKGK